ncbi:MAG TPA: dihydrofolate reductase family protein [Gemmataceae bacterium]|jgi:dihydrofolate reductase
MRRVRYCVAMSLDGYIAGPKGEYDWLIMDPEMDFGALWAEFDTFLIGRKTFETMARAGRSRMHGVEVFVFSRTLRQKEHPEVTIVADKQAQTVAALKKKKRGKDIWLFGGGSLFQSLLNKGLVDTVEVAVEPVLLGGGIPLLPPPAKQTQLKLTGHKIYKKTGIVSLQYQIK